MADSKSSTPSASGSSASANPKPAAPRAAPTGNPALRMLGLPSLPRKLPSRNWMIFWTLTGTITAAIVYDKRGKNRATAKWRHAVEHLAKEPISSPNQLPRKLTIYLEAPPGDGLRSAQDHFIEYAKPVLAASGLDWEFVQGRQQGDVRAAVAEKIRRTRKAHERPDEELTATDDSTVEDLRKRMGLPEYEGVKGDVVVGRHTWKEYIRGLHEGWLGPLDAPVQPLAEDPKPETASPSTGEGAVQNDEIKAHEKQEEKKEDKPKRPPQPIPYNSPDNYSEAALPAYIPSEFSPSSAIQFPHRLGFRHTFVRLARFFNRRKLADDIGREVAAICFATSRNYREADGHHEQELILQHEERNWPNSVWKEKTESQEAPEDDKDKMPEPPKEKIWASPIKVDSRLAQRMRRFELQPDDEARAAEIVVPEVEIEGWIKRNFRHLGRWSVSLWSPKPKGPNVGDLDD